MTIPDDKKAALHAKLQKAIELEWATIPPYLTAWYSLCPGHNATVGSIIKTIFMEEMLHLVLAANVLAAVGGGARLGRDNLPVYPLTLEFEGQQFRDRKFDVHLAPFSKESLDIFVRIETPVSELQDVGLVVPGITIGDFYQSIEADLQTLCADYGEAAVFSGDPALQVPEDFYWSARGGIVVVHDLVTALTALKLIVDQGEGAPAVPDDPAGNYSGDPNDLPHYHRFREIQVGKAYKKGESLANAPTGEDIPVDYGAVYAFKPDCKAADLAASPDLSDLNIRFNTSYTRMLRQLEEGFNGNPQVLYTAIMKEMHGLTPMARAIMQTPLPGGLDGLGAMPTFEWVQTDDV